MKKFTLLLFLISFSFIYKSNSQDYTFDVPEKETLVITFGSCNKQDKPQPLWDDIMAHNPDLFLFLGDNIYGDTQDMTLLEQKYNIQKQQPDYLKFQKNTNIVGVWDDHDYGKNDAGKEYLMKKESQGLLLDFFDVSENSPLRERKGTYSSSLINWNGKKIKILLLDARYHRDQLEKKDRIYVPNKLGTILGDEQWRWLAEELSDNSIDLYLIASGIQFIAEDHPYEKWANFPNERERLFDLIADKKPKGVLMLSGDRHIAEISKQKWKGLKYPLFDITSSGLTHTWSGSGTPEEYNQHRVGELIAQLNYGVLEISLKKAGDLSISAQVRGDDQIIYLAEEIDF